ncbi:germinal-center associated nuclear protein [Drosophila obscura]|uniref:germinal-center associated nuclear protein n=1 Tax=Drosophila obscura TaxID=7282 RepID=UPI001BB24313|nr:germinal-center associated nuclear protein [Drosophila obscura]
MRSIMAKIQGTCEEFCPDGEIKMRVRERMLHFFELKNGQKNVPGILVKEFTRSAADVKMPKKEDMRTVQCLTRTVEYLLKEIVMDNRMPYRMAYDFIFDRLRAVRREIVIQMLDAKQTAKLLEPIVMFLAYSRYRLCAEPIDMFDAKICNQHLQECLTGVLCCYKTFDEDETAKSPTIRDLQRRCFIESVYQVFNLGCPESLERALTLPDHVRQDPTFKLCFQMSLSYHQENLYRVLVALPKLPHILCALAATKLQMIRRRILQMFTHAYNKQFNVPGSYLLRVMLIDSPEHLTQQCCHYGLEVSKEFERVPVLCNRSVFKNPAETKLLYIPGAGNVPKAVRFNKSDFINSAETIKEQHEQFVDSKLKRVYLPEVLLLKKFV